MFVEAPVMAKLADSHFNTTRELRNLANLNFSSASTRVLNLSRLYTVFREDEEYKAAPLFENSALNRAIILKHNLRVDERHLFPNHRQTVTKVILPFDPYDLSLGGRAVFVRQQHFEQLVKTFFGIEDLARSKDIEILRTLDRLPSLDPFLVREHLLKIGVRPARMFFQISPADLKSMAAFTAQEVENLVNAALGGEAMQGGAKFSNKILSDQLDQELWPLKETLRMTDDQFSNGIMCWRGFLYYKWAYVELQGSIRDVLHGLSHYKPVPTHEDMVRNYLRRARPRIAKALVKTIQETGLMLEAYDDVYRAMAVERDPDPFRSFLMRGSNLFFELGEKLGVLNHIVSFWKFRMARVLANNSRPLESIEYADILIDFEAGLFNSLVRDERAA
ncbi:MAG TPA: hypothetical protein VG839_07425 [Asticcacaulis sp.]|nr:hypothetical protein [Asticcacaulis sp.]